LNIFSDRFFAIGQTDFFQKHFPMKCILDIIETTIGSVEISYARQDALMDYETAVAWCNGLGGSFPVPTSPEENEFLRQLGNTFLGFGTNSDLSALTWTNWGPGTVS